MSSNENYYVLEFTSSVMFGSEGSKCSQLALETMGIDVCPITIDAFSVHFFYDHYNFIQMSTEDLGKTYAALKANNLHMRFTHIITGYAGSSELLTKVAEIVKDIKECNPDVVYLCDPVLGDNDDFYKTLTPDVKEVFTDLLVPMSDISTPNQFEVEALSGMKIHCQEDALKALQRLHEKGPSTVIMTSSKMGDNDTIVTISSRVKDGKREAYRIEFPVIDAYLVGTGDLLASSFLGYLIKTDDLKSSFEKAISVVQLACQRTMRDTRERVGPGVELTSQLLELRVAQIGPFIRDPQVIYPSTKLL